MKILQIELNRGSIKTNEFYQTNEPNIYAIGDVIGGLQLAHVASHEGIIAIEHIAGENPAPLDSTLVSKCVYCSPEVASVGFNRRTSKGKRLSSKNR